MHKNTSDDVSSGVLTVHVYKYVLKIRGMKIQLTLNFYLFKRFLYHPFLHSVVHNIIIEIQQIIIINNNKLLNKYNMQVFTCFFCCNL